MDNKKILRYGLFAVLAIIFLIVACPRTFKAGTGNGSIDIPAISDTCLATPNSVTIIVDNSGSMKGYLDFAGFVASNNHFAATVSDIVSDSKRNMTGIKDYTIKIGSQILDNDNLVDQLTKSKQFGGAVTEIDKLVADLCSKASDDNVAILVSDMILSGGLQKINAENDKFWKKNNLNNLGGKLNDSFTKLKNNDLQILLLKYESDFNGNYYYDCTENQLKGKIFKDSMMTNRPYYIMAAGKADILKNMVLKNCFADKCTAVWSTLSLNDNDFRTENMTEVRFTSNQGAWVIGGGNDETLCISTKAKQDNTAELTLEWTPFSIPLFLKSGIYKCLINDGLSKAITSANVTVNDGRISSATLSLAPTDKNFDTSGTITIMSESAANNSSIEDDTDKTMEQMKSKTWGFNTVIEQLRKVYNISDERTVASFDIRIAKY